MNKRFLIIDGNSLLCRAYYATAYAGVEKIMRTSTGQPTNAIFAFANMMVKILNDLGTDDSIFVAFDTGKKTFRHKEYDEYKAGRQQVPDELISQFAIAREFLDALNIKHHEIEGFEADDLAGSLALKASKAGYNVELYTSDQDYFQLISPNVTVELIKKGLSDVLTLTPEKLYEEYGFTPAQVTDFKGLTGDASDNLKGIPGVGKVTALKLLNEYDNLENIIANAHNIKGRVGEDIREFASVAETSKYLATIVTDVPIAEDLSFFHYTGFDSSEAQKFASKYELRTFMNNLKYRPSQKDTEIVVKTIENSNGLKLTKLKSFAFHFDGDDPNYFDAKLANIYFKIDNIIYKMAFKDFKDVPAFVAILEDATITKYGYDLKRSAVMLANENITLRGIYNDAALVAYLNDSNANASLKVFLLNFGYNVPRDELLIPTLVYNVEDAYHIGYKRLENDGLVKLYEEIERPLLKVLIKMEVAGIDVDRQILTTIGAEYKAIIENLTNQIYEAAGHEFNINSPQQVAVVLFDELGLKANRKRSTAVDILNVLKNTHAIIPLILEYRKYQKIISNYIDGLMPHIHEDGKIHTSFNQLLTTTGRLSSNNPNLQNISVRAEEGREVRKAFYAKDHKLLSIDYSQIELRLLACIAGSSELIDVFNADRDIHAETALRLFPLEDLDYSRRKAKAVNFGIVYGISDFGLAEQLDISVPEARLIITMFYENYPEIRTYRENIISDVQTNGFVTTLTGRKRYLPQINDPNYQTREFAKRAAMNAPIQGSAADLIKLAMIKVDEYLEIGHYKTKLLLQVHDELIFALHHDEEHIINDIVRIMENIFTLPLRLKVGVNIGANWFEAS